MHFFQYTCIIVLILNDSINKPQAHRKSYKISAQVSTTIKSNQPGAYGIPKEIYNITRYIFNVVVYLFTVGTRLAACMRHIIFFWFCLFYWSYSDIYTWTNTVNVLASFSFVRYVIHTFRDFTAKFPLHSFFLWVFSVFCTFLLFSFPPAQSEKCSHRSRTSSWL
jgi:hypothetical protein